jgi:SAM-dependent methyltransferase
VELSRAKALPCPLCGTRADKPFFTLCDMPVFCCVLWPSKEEARAAARTDIQLTSCPSCGMVYNQAFDPSLVEYAPGYENALHFSPLFRAYADVLARRLVGDYKLSGGVVAEIGSGDGFFLDLMTRHGARLGIGYDPTVPESQREKVKIIPAYFEAGRLPEALDAVVCRHVLEHLGSPLTFMRQMREALAHRAPVVYFEVPNGEWMLETFNLGSVIYEHFTYWTPTSLRTLFARSGYAPIAVYTDFEDQFLSIIARPTSEPASSEGPDPTEAVRIAASCQRFGARCQALVVDWRQTVSDLSGRTAVLWGAGSKGVTFANVTANEVSALAGIVDINPRKHGKYVAGCGLPVIAPEQLVSLKPEIVLLLNDIYHEEVKDFLTSHGLKAEICHVHAP